jgi:biotin operon repressor
MQIELDIIGALNKEEKLWQDLNYIVRQTKNRSLVARQLGISRKNLWKWINGRTISLSYSHGVLIQEYAEQLRKQFPPSSQS